MKTRIFKGFAAAIVMAAGLSSSPVSADSGFEQAHQLRSLDIMLMVTALRCRSGPDDFQADYNRFAAAHLNTLNRAGADLRGAFARSSDGGNPERALDRMGVAIANSYGDGHPWLGCAELRQMAQDLSSHSDPQVLAQAASYAMSAQRPTHRIAQAQPRIARIGYSMAGLIGAGAGDGL